MINDHILLAEDSSSPCIVLGCMDGTEDDGNPIALNYNDHGDAVADPLTGIDGVDVNIDDVLVFINMYMVVWILMRLIMML